MIKLVTYFVTFVTGASVGALVSHIVTKNKEVKKSLERIEEMHAYYEEIFGHVDIPAEILSEQNETNSDDIITTVKPSEPIVRETKISEYTDYTQYYSSEPAENEHPSEDEEVPELDENYSQGEYLTREIKETRSANKSRAPRIIKHEECGEDPAYRLINLTYYCGDDILVESGGEFFYTQEDIDVINDMVGDALDKYGFKESDEDTICVRNYAYGVDYEIVKDLGSYSELVGKGV